MKSNMKKSIGYILIMLPILFFCLLAFVTAEKSSEKTITGVNDEVKSAMDFDNPFDNYIAFKYDESGKIDKEKIVEYWNEHLDLEESVEFTDFKIIFSDPAEHNKQYFMLSARSDDGRISIGSHLDIDENMFLLSGGTCSCTTSHCSQSGCTVEAGEGCSCSFCPGDCVKTHTEPVPVEN